MPPTSERAPTAMLYGTTPVRLGRVKPAGRPQSLRFKDYFVASAVGGNPPPASYDLSPKAMESLRRMYLNDRYGCCVISGKAHAVGTWSGNDAGAAVLASDAEISSAYFGICGPGDNGCVITEVLDVMRSRGIPFGGKARKIDGYVSVDNRDQLETKVAILIFGGVCIGFNVPSAWMDTPDGGVWDNNVPLRFVGGHDVQIVGYNATGVILSTWGGLRTMTWRAWSDTRIVDEVYAILSPDWYNGDNLAPNGIDVATLKADLAKLAGNGDLPDWEPPVPVPPPPPPPGPPPVPPPVPPPLPAVLHGKGTVESVQVVVTMPAQKINVPSGLFGRAVQIPIPAQSVTVTVPGQTIAVDVPTTQ